MKISDFSVGLPVVDVTPNLCGSICSGASKVPARSEPCCRLSASWSTDRPKSVNTTLSSPLSGSFGRGFTTITFPWSVVRTIHSWLHGWPFLLTGCKSPWEIPWLCRCLSPSIIWSSYEDTLVWWQVPTNLDALTHRYMSPWWASPHRPFVSFFAIFFKKFRAEPSLCHGETIKSSSSVLAIPNKEIRRSCLRVFHTNAS